MDGWSRHAASYLLVMNIPFIWGRATGRPVWVAGRPQGDVPLVFAACVVLTAGSKLAAETLKGSCTLAFVRLLTVLMYPPESRLKLPIRGVTGRAEDEVLGELSRPDAA